jgi:hypothetical protein
MCDLFTDSVSYFPFSVVIYWQPKPFISIFSIQVFLHLFHQRSLQFLQSFAFQQAVISPFDECFSSPLVLRTCPFTPPPRYLLRWFLLSHFVSPFLSLDTLTICVFKSTRWVNNFRAPHFSRFFDRTTVSLLLPFVTTYRSLSLFHPLIHVYRYKTVL